MWKLFNRVVGFMIGKLQPHVGSLVRIPETEQQFTSFEDLHQIKLPESYVDALLSPKLISPFAPLNEWCQPSSEEEMSPSFLANPFPHSNAWNDLSLFSEDKSWDSQYFNERWWQGSMRVSNLGCEGYTLLVISGPCRGQLWCDLRVPEMKGIFPLEKRGGERLSIQDAWKGFNLRYGGKRDDSSSVEYFAEHIKPNAE